MDRTLVDGKFIIAVDFDGTITDNPNMSDELRLREGCRESLFSIKDMGATLVLWTCRTGSSFAEAVSFLEEKGMLKWFSEFNSGVPEVMSKYNTDARKIGADMYIDDKGPLESLFGVNWWVYEQAVRKKMEELDLA